MLALLVGSLLLIAAYVYLHPARAAPVPPPGSPTPPERPREQRALYELLNRAAESRDDAWAAELRLQLPKGEFVALGGQGAGGAIGARCLRARLGGGTPFDHLMRIATDEGSGLSLEAREGGVRTEVSFGQLATLRMFGNWRAPGLWSGPPGATGEWVLQEETAIDIGAPSLEYLPEFVRVALRGQLAGLGISEPKVLLVNWPEERRRDLVFSVFPENFNSMEAYQHAMASLIWHLPDGYQVLDARALRGPLEQAGPL